MISPQWVSNARQSYQIHKRNISIAVPTTFRKGRTQWSKKLDAVFAFWLISWTILGQFSQNKMYFVKKTRNILWKQYLLIFGDFSGGFRCILVQLLLIHTLFTVQFYIRRTAILFSIEWYDYFVRRVNRFKVMIDFLRDFSAYPVLCKTLWGMFETFHMSCTKKHIKSFLLQSNR